ncbi:copper resistance protein CopC [Paenibacillus alginolyticus]|uniref:Copper resistance protein CopC n=1 Tax=Paenibacillus alginolyticus TaxID=59839 RepID=A0ABT4GB18_9BACL|nr:copper resistance protein CopC [Paenibacillus alginolyticus]MCY9693380.1 copper resistance protein CopC [Paenibacillus alginolyticus]MEC0144639.1 copper resistance protein CopC [Paenibacillus alginolyticus]
MRHGFTVLLFFFLLILNNNLSYAHSSIEQMAPKAGEVLEKAPKQIDLWFEDPVEISKGSIIVSNEQNELVSVGQPETDPQDKRHVTMTLLQGLPLGKYSVIIDVFSIDGHQVKEKYQFDVKKTILTQEEQLQRFKLEESNPVDGNILSFSPEVIDLWFTDNTQVTAFGLFDDLGKTVSTTNPVQDSTNKKHYTINLKKQLHKGTYSAHWYATVGNFEKNGIFYFAVQEYTPIQGSNGISQDSLFSHVSFLQFAHWLTFLGVFSLAGGLLFQLFMAKGTGNILRWRKFSYLFYVVSLLGFIIELISFRLKTIHVPLHDFVTYQFVWVTIIQLITLSVGFCIPRITIRLSILVFTVQLWAITGHSSMPSNGGILSIVLDGFHLLAVTVWLGGLLAIILMLPRDNSIDWLKKVGGTYSKWALASIFIIVITGVWMTSNYVPTYSTESFIASNWGKLIVIKIVLLIVILFIGVLQRNYLKNITTSVLRILRQLKIEVYFGVILLIIASVLIDLSPKEAEQGIYPSSITANGVRAVVGITPLKIGKNDMVIRFENQPEFKSVRMKLMMPPDSIIENKAFSLGNGEYRLTGNLLHAAGIVQSQIIAETSAGQEIIFSFEIRVPGVMIDS